MAVAIQWVIFWKILKWLQGIGFFILGDIIFSFLGEIWLKAGQSFFNPSSQGIEKKLYSLRALRLCGEK
jgi:hypothetical protein